MITQTKFPIPTTNNSANNKLHLYIEDDNTIHNGKWVEVYWNKQIEGKQQMAFYKQYDY